MPYFIRTLQFSVVVVVAVVKMAPFTVFGEILERQIFD